MRPLDALRAPGAQARRASRERPSAGPCGAESVREALACRPSALVALRPGGLWLGWESRQGGTPIPGRGIQTRCAPWALRPAERPRSALALAPAGPKASGRHLRAARPPKISPGRLFLQFALNVWFSSIASQLSALRAAKLPFSKIAGRPSPASSGHPWPISARWAWLAFMPLSGRSPASSAARGRATFGRPVAGLLSKQGGRSAHADLPPFRFLSVS